VGEAIVGDEAVPGGTGECHVQAAASYRLLEDFVGSNVVAADESS
jgi:hypothetical protein